jgi:hypothetical protein
MGYQYQSEKEIEAVVKGFENCTIARDEFTHREHLTVAVWYVRADPQQALEKMRSGLLRFLNHHGVANTKYKENLTVSWITLIQTTLAELDPDLSLLEVTNVVLDGLGDPRLIPFDGPG